VAEIRDGPEPEPAIVLFGEKGRPGFEQSISIAVAKRFGTSATALAELVQRKVEALRGKLILRRCRCR